MFIENNIINVSQYEAICLPVIAPKKSIQSERCRQMTSSEGKKTISFSDTMLVHLLFFPLLRVSRKPNETYNIQNTLHTDRLHVRAVRYFRVHCNTRATFKPSHTSARRVHAHSHALSHGHAHRNLCAASYKTTCDETIENSGRCYSLHRQNGAFT